MIVKTWVLERVVLFWKLSINIIGPIYERANLDGISVDDALAGSDDDLEVVSPFEEDGEEDEVGAGVLDDELDGGLDVDVDSVVEDDDDVGVVVGCVDEVLVDELEEVEVGEVEVGEVVLESVVGVVTSDCVCDTEDVGVELEDEDDDMVDETVVAVSEEEASLEDEELDAVCVL